MIKRDNIKMKKADMVTLADLLWHYNQDKMLADGKGFDVNEPMFRPYKGDSCVSLNDAIQRVMSELNKDGVTFDMVMDRALERLL